MAEPVLDEEARGRVRDAIRRAMFMTAAFDMMIPAYQAGRAYEHYKADPSKAPQGYLHADWYAMAATDAAIEAVLAELGHG